ncbi:hypothetical protein GS909_23525 [Rhodococcus hoagii]|nr:hypothetical protein [Prescottella equi]
MAIPPTGTSWRKVKGLSAFGGISGYIVISVCPPLTSSIVLEAIVVHELHHNVRYLAGGVVWDRSQ